MGKSGEHAFVLQLVADEFQKKLQNSQGALSSFNNFLSDWKTQLAKGTAYYGE